MQRFAVMKISQSLVNWYNNKRVCTAVHSPLLPPGSERLLSLLPAAHNTLLFCQSDATPDNGPPEQVRRG